MDANYAAGTSPIATSPRTRIPRPDQRTQLARAEKRWRGIISAATRHNDDPLVQAKVKRAAALCAIAEQSRAACLVDPSPDALRLLQRAERMASAACHGLAYFGF
jgi:hypothetical protein